MAHTPRKLVIFDLDGTLVDTARDVSSCFDAALVENGFPPRGLAAVAPLLGRPLEVIVAGLLPEDAAQDERIVSSVASSYRASYAASPKPHTKPFPGMEKLCRTLVERGVPVAVNTNKPHGNAVAVIESLFPGIPMRVSGYGDVPTTKPSPEGAELLMREAGATPSETVYVGDTVIDLETAVHAGIDCILVTWGQGSPELFSDGRAWAIAQTADDIARLISGNGPSEPDRMPGDSAEDADRPRGGGSAPGEAR